MSRFIQQFREAGVLRRRQGQLAIVPYQARILTLNDLEPLCQLHKRILNELPAPHLLRPNKPEFFIRHLTDSGYSLGIFVEDEMIGYAVLGLALESVATFGDDLNLSAAELALAAHLDGVGVIPDWRGNHLHWLLLSWRIRLASCAGRRHMIATTAPDNVVVWNNMLTLGLRVKGLKHKYGGFLRYILHDDLANPSWVDFDTTISMPTGDITGQQDLLAQGYWGYALNYCGSAEKCLLYGKPLQDSGNEAA
ncbi:MAG: hypothetical protein V2J55_07620 [Candidatus Competibacteraceae bacterium]|jgi:hypothetical protein|nr:hypothetical protein [Candidatus Competibacteraceae bacterium]